MCFLSKHNFKLWEGSYMAIKKDENKKFGSPRDPLTYDIYCEIMYAPRPFRAGRVSWARFRIMSTLLYYTGMRLNEAGKFTDKMIVELIEQNSTIILQSKLGAERRLFVSKHAVTRLEELLPDHRNVFKTPDQLFPFYGKNSTSLIKSY